MHEWLFANVSQWRSQDPVSILIDAAAQLGLDTDAFSACIQQQEGQEFDELVEDYREGQQYGIRGTPNFVINGHLLTGALPFGQFAQIIDVLIEQAETGALPATVATVAPTATPDIDFAIEDFAVIGEADAPVTIVEFSDYQCPFCLRHFNETMPQIKQQYIETGQVRYIFKDFTPTLFNPDYHPQAVTAAQAADCAGQQDAYWAMHDKLFGEQGRWAGNASAPAVMAAFAAEIGLEAEAFAACMASDSVRSSISAELQEGIAAGVSGTPAFFINGVFLNGAQPFAVFQQVIEAELAK